MTIEVIEAGWDVPVHVRAFTTTRSGGVGAAPFDTLNLASHVDDSAQAVEENRARLARQYDLPSQPAWLQQVHGATIVRADTYRGGQDADGAWTSTPRVVCAVLTADCLPLFLCSAEGRRVGLFHIGWRGLAQGLVGKAAELFGAGAWAWLGPAIGPAVFEIGAEVKAAIEQPLGPHPDCFAASRRGKWLLNLYALVAAELERRDIACVYDEALCTHTDGRRFFSYRRGQRCGRMASLIWMSR